MFCCFLGSNESNKMAGQWGYGKENGPSTWAKNYPTAKGKRQSPIDIRTNKCTYDPNLSSSIFNFNYDESDATSVTNNGHSVQINLSQSSTSSFTGGPAKDKTYQLKQFHFHWGSKDGVGSEHKVDGKTYSAELHLVHWNTDYGSFENALLQSDGLIVLAIFIDIGKKHHEIGKLTHHFSQIKFPDDVHPLPHGFNFNKLLPSNLDDYWTYEGSLTTPPCSEVVQFIVFKEPIEISEEEMEAFRTLKARPATRETDDQYSHTHQLVDNFRHVMPLDKRIVYASFT